MEILGVLAAIAFVVGIPILRQRAKERRIQREWHARGCGFAQGKYSVARHPSYYRDPAELPAAQPPDPFAEIVPQKEPRSPFFRALAWIAVALTGLTGATLFFASLGHTTAHTNNGVTLTADPSTGQHKATKPAHRRAGQQTAQQIETVDVKDDPACKAVLSMRASGDAPPEATREACSNRIFFEQARGKRVTLAGIVQK